MNEIVFESHPIPQLMYTLAVDVAELFVLFHEFQHAVPAPPEFRVKIDVSASQSSAWRSEWVQELQADANAEFMLLIAATDFFSRVFNLPAPAAKKVAAGTVFYGADAALDALRVLEQVKCGEVSLEKAASDPIFTNHPPADYRRNFLSRVSNRLALSFMDQATWSEIQQSVGSMISVRKQLYDRFFASKPLIASQV